MKIASYDPSICDLCGSSESVTIIERERERGMTSDSRIVTRNLKKVVCTRCGLVRDGLPFEGFHLTQHYTQTYQLNIKKFGEEHLFYTSSGVIPRSQVIHDWIIGLKPQSEWNSVDTVLEVGCGQGNLLSRLSNTFPDITFEGVDLSEHAVSAAKRKGLNVFCGDVDEAPSDRYDLIIAFGVLEHTPSPTTFLKALGDRLSKNGEVIIGQPIHDVESYDLFFVDHLHHFGSKHIKFISKKAGFNESRAIIGHPLMPNFSLHLLTVCEIQQFNLQAVKPPIETRCTATTEKWQSIFNNVNSELENLQESDRVAVFGVGEVFTLLYTYTNLVDAKIVCGLDDSEEHQYNNPWQFPVVSPEKAKEFGITKLFLCVNPIYNSLVIPRIKKLNIDIDIKTFL